MGEGTVEPNRNYGGGVAVAAVVVVLDVVEVEVEPPPAEDVNVVVPLRESAPPQAFPYRVN